MLAVLMSAEAVANPLLGTAGEFAAFCRNASRRIGSQEQIACMAFVGGVMQGHRIGSVSGLVYGIDGVNPDDTSTYGMTGLTKIGSATESGHVDGYCLGNSPSFTWGQATQTAVDYIDRNPKARGLGPAAMIMRALAANYPCKGR